MSTTPHVAGATRKHPSTYAEITDHMVDAELARQDAQNMDLLFNQGKRRRRSIIVASVAGFLIVAAIAVGVTLVLSGVFADHGPTAEQQAATAKQNYVNTAIANCKADVAKQLKDPTSALFTDIDVQLPEKIMGSVNGKNVYGAYVGASPFTCYMSQEGYVIGSFVADN